MAQTATYINAGDEIELALPESSSRDNRLVLPLEVLYEDDYLAVIHKPAGILVSGNKFVTVANGLAQNLKKSTLEDSTHPTPIHRLDYGTTGALLVGKTSSSIRALSALFASKEISKTYYAVTIGKMKRQGRINSEIENKPSVSHYEVLECVESPRFGFLNLVKINPETGRRHQLRIHLASIGHPILGDQDYAIDGQVLKGKGIYLHAYSLEFNHPNTGENLFIKSPLPKKYKKLFPQVTSINLEA